MSIAHSQHDCQEIPFYNESEITRHATTEPIDDYIGQMLAAPRPTPLEEVAAHVFDEVRKATGDLFKAWEDMRQVLAAGLAERNGNGSSVDYYEAPVRATEPWSSDPEPSFFPDEVTHE